MKILIILFSLLAVSSNTFCKPKIDSVLQKKIMVMFKEDQKWRIEADHVENNKTSSFTAVIIDKNIGVTDSLNMIKAKGIVAKYGYPGYSLVGQDGSNAFWAIIQHCDKDLKFQEKALALMLKEVKKKNASGENLALLQDRVLVSQGRKQLYGTQVRVDAITHHAKSFAIQDSLNVDTRRKEVGLQPLNDYLKLFEGH